MPPDSNNVPAAIGIAGKVIDLASDSPELREAGRTAAKSTLTVARAVNNILLPIAAVNFAFDKASEYFRNKFRQDLEEAAADIPSEAIVEPSPSVAAPALHGLAFSHEEPDLKSMYLNLLRTAMDGRGLRSAHPAYAEVIRQLAAHEAGMFNRIVEARPKLPIVTLMGGSGGEIRAVRNNILDLIDGSTGKPVERPFAQSMIDNWLRLGLISITYDLSLVASDAYDWVQQRPEYIELDSQHNTVEVRKGILELSAFGKSFAEAVGSGNL